MRKIAKTNELDIIVPIALDLDWPDKEMVINDIIELNSKYGFTRFAISTPSAGWRSVGYPPEDFIKNSAETFKEIKERVAVYGIDCGWWNTLTIKSGHNPDFHPIVLSNGEEHAFSNCPLCENFKRRFSKDIALFAKIADPLFIITEDDFSVLASMGCYCNLHLKAFEKKYGIAVSREELTQMLSKTTPEAIETIRKWRSVLKDSMVDLARAMREELDKVCPHIPMGYMQAGCADDEGDITEEIAKALAGPAHTPFSRLFGASYSGIISRHIPAMLYHMLYSKQHMKEDFCCYLEADTFPHTRFYTSGCQIGAAIAVVSSYGFEGATFQAQQLLDCPNEETAYGKMYLKEHKRLNEISKRTKDCELKGVKIDYDPFLNTVDKVIRHPLWLNPVARFGIPYTTKDSDVLFWDIKQAKFADDEKVMNALSKNIFLDAEAAKCLCERGFSEFLGVNVGDNLSENSNIKYDLAAREIICEPFREKNKGKHMTTPWLLGNGKLYKLDIVDKKCESVAEFYSYEKNLLTSSLTRFENKLGGKVIVMGIVLDNNRSQSLFNYRRKRLMHSLIEWCCDDYVLVKEAPDVMIIENKAKNPETAGFKEILTVINLCEDMLDEVELHLPEYLRHDVTVEVLNHDGKWNKVAYELIPDGIKISQPLNYCVPMYLALK